MFAIGFFKGKPTEYTIKFVNGRIRRAGEGLSFFYWAPTTTIATISITTIDANFVFNEMTQTFQEVTIQGQLTYRIADPKKISSILDFSVNPWNRKYLSDDPDRFVRRIVNAVQMATRGEIQKHSLEDCLRNSEMIAKTVLEKVKQDSTFGDLGVECLSIYFISLKPTPELAKALEAEYREMIQKKADAAIYSRRAAAVEQERKIKENELDSEIALEKSRQELIELNGYNALKEAEFHSKAAEVEFTAYRNIDPKLLLAIGMKSLGEQANKISHLSITPELLSTLIDSKK